MCGNKFSVKLIICEVAHDVFHAERNKKTTFSSQVTARAHTCTGYACQEFQPFHIKYKYFRLKREGERENEIRVHFAPSNWIQFYESVIQLCMLISRPLPVWCWRPCSLQMRSLSINDFSVSCFFCCSCFVAVKCITSPDFKLHKISLSSCCTTVNTNHYD